jgi:hypothetical protein
LRCDSLNGEDETMTLTLELPAATEEKLKERARERGKDVEAYVRELVEQDISPSWDELVKPVHDEFERSGMTQEELDDLTDELISEVRAEKTLHRR